MTAPHIRATRKTSPTFGLSYNDDGTVQWQFVIDEISDYAVKITTFSWLTGYRYSEQTVTKDFIENRCLLFTNHADFLEAADDPDGRFLPKRPDAPSHNSQSPTTGPGRATNP